jgi:acyl-CoA thioester hydrolase
LWDSEGGFFVVAEASLRYLHSARLDDGLTITTEPTAIGRAAITVRQQAWRNPCEPGQAPLLLCDGTVRAAWVSGPQRKPGRIPSTVLNLL